MPEKKPRKCPKCKSIYVQRSSINIKNGQDVYYCYYCNHIWSEDIKLLEYKGKVTMKKLKDERKKFNYLGKIKPDDVANVIIDLFIMGGRTFYRKTIRYRRKKK